MPTLRNWRKQRNLTLEELAAQTGIPVPSLSRLERDPATLKVRTLLQIHSFTEGEVTPNDFCGFSDPTIAAAESCGHLTNSEKVLDGGGHD